MEAGFKLNPMNPHTLFSMKNITIANTGNHAKNANLKNNRIFYPHFTREATQASIEVFHELRTSPV